MIRITEKLLLKNQTDGAAEAKEEILHNQTELEIEKDYKQKINTILGQEVKSKANTKLVDHF